MACETITVRQKSSRIKLRLLCLGEKASARVRRRGGPRVAPGSEVTSPVNREPLRTDHLAYSPGHKLHRGSDALSTRDGNLDVGPLHVVLRTGCRGVFRPQTQDCCGEVAELDGLHGSALSSSPHPIQ